MCIHFRAFETITCTNMYINTEQQRLFVLVLILYLHPSIRRFLFENSSRTNCERHAITQIFNILLLNNCVTCAKLLNNAHIRLHQPLYFSTGPSSPFSLWHLFHHLPLKTNSVLFLFLEVSSFGSGKTNVPVHLYQKHSHEIIEFPFQRFLETTTLQPRIISNLALFTLTEVFTWSFSILFWLVNPILFRILGSM